MKCHGFLLCLQLKTSALQQQGVGAVISPSARARWEDRLAHGPFSTIARGDFRVAAASPVLQGVPGAERRPVTLRRLLARRVQRARHSGLVPPPSQLLAPQLIPRGLSANAARGKIPVTAHAA